MGERRYYHNLVKRHTSLEREKQEKQTAPQQQSESLQEQQRHLAMTDAEFEAEQRRKQDEKERAPEDFVTEFQRLSGELQELEKQWMNVEGQIRAYKKQERKGESVDPVYRFIQFQNAAELLPQFRERIEAMKHTEAGELFAAEMLDNRLREYMKHVTVVEREFGRLDAAERRSGLRGLSESTVLFLAAAVNQDSAIEQQLRIERILNTQEIRDGEKRLPKWTRDTVSAVVQRFGDASQYPKNMKACADELYMELQSQRTLDGNVMYMTLLSEAYLLFAARAQQHYGENDPEGDVHRAQNILERLRDFWMQKAVEVKLGNVWMSEIPTDGDGPMELPPKDSAMTADVPAREIAAKYDMYLEYFPEILTAIQRYETADRRSFTPSENSDPFEGWDKK